ncbi:MAG: hypothetical protein ACI37Z_03575 [Candidatus Gastranaerophilaceae bacterium]
MTQTNIIYGFGFEVSEVKEKNLINFLTSHQETVSKKGLQVWTEDGINTQAHCTVTDTEGTNAVIQNIMQAETGIDFEFHIDEETQQEFILLPELMPWLYNAVEKALTEKSLNEILNWYIAELRIAVSPENIRIEYLE